MPVRPRQHRADHHRVHRGAERERRVRALVHRHVHAHAEQRAVVAQRGLDVERLLARLAGDEQVLVAVLDPLHRPAEVDGGGEHRDVFAGRQHLHAERAADVLRGDARQRDRVAGQQPEQHPREVHDAHRLAQERLRHRLARRRRRRQPFAHRFLDRGVLGGRRPATRRALLAAAIALAFCSSPAMRSR